MTTKTGKPSKMARRATKALIEGGWIVGVKGANRIAEIIDQETAAPDLYAACAAILPMVEADYDELGVDDPYQQAIGALRAALAKARGE